MNPFHSYTLTINDITLGFLQSFEETITREVKQQWGYRENAVKKLLPGKCSYILKLKRLRVPDAIPGKLEELRSFSMTLTSEDRVIVYTGCEFASLTVSTDVNGKMLEEAVVYVKERSVSSD